MPTLAVFSQSTMSARWLIRISGARQRGAEPAQAAHKAFLTLKKIEKALSKSLADSDIARANALKKGERLRLQPETFECLKLAHSLSQQTAKAFDPAAGTLIDFWTRQQRQQAACGNGGGFCEEMPEWRAAFENFRFGAFSLDGNSGEIVCDNAGAKLDLGGIAKGFALKKMAEDLESLGIESALLSAGGSTILALDAPEGRDNGWEIALGNRPETIFIKNEALSSSGSPQRKACLVDPRSGLPATTTNPTRVIARDPAVADALSTALAVMSPAERVQFATTMPDIKIL